MTATNETFYCNHCFIPVTVDDFFDNHINGKCVEGKVERIIGILSDGRVLMERIDEKIEDFKPCVSKRGIFEKETY